MAELLLGAPATAVDSERATEPPKKSPEAPSTAVSLACRCQVVPERTNTSSPRARSGRGRPPPRWSRRWPPTRRRSRSWRGRGRSAWPAATRAVPERTNTYAAPGAVLEIWVAATTTVGPRPPPNSRSRCPGQRRRRSAWRAGDQVTRAHEHIRRPGVRVLVDGADHHGGAGDRDRVAEARRLPSEVVSLACWCQAVPERRRHTPPPELVLGRRADHRGGARDRHRVAEAVDRAGWEAVSLACCIHSVPARSNTYAAPAREFLSGAPTTAVEPEIATDRPNSSPAAA